MAPIPIPVFETVPEGFIDRAELESLFPKYSQEIAVRMKFNRISNVIKVGDNLYIMRNTAESWVADKEHKRSLELARLKELEEARTTAPMTTAPPPARPTGGPNPMLELIELSRKQVELLERLLACWETKQPKG